MKNKRNRRFIHVFYSSIIVILIIIFSFLRDGKRKPALKDKQERKEGNSMLNSWLEHEATFDKSTITSLEINEYLTNQELLHSQFFGENW